MSPQPVAARALSSLELRHRHAGLPAPGLLAFSPDGTLLLTGAERPGLLRLWALPGGGLVKVLRTADTMELYAAAFTADGKEVVASGIDGHLRPLEVRFALPGGRFLGARPTGEARRPGAREPLSPDGSRVVRAGALVDPRSGATLVASLAPAEENLVAGAASFSPDGGRLALAVSGVEVGGERRAGILLLDGRTGTPEPLWLGHQPLPFEGGDEALERQVAALGAAPADPGVDPDAHRPVAAAEGSLLAIAPEQLAAPLELPRSSYALDLPAGSAFVAEATPRSRVTYTVDSVAEYSMLFLRARGATEKESAGLLDLLEGDPSFLPLTRDVEEKVVAGPHGPIAERCSRPAPGRLTCRLEIRLPKETLYGVLRDAPDAQLPLFAAIVRSIRPLSGKPAHR